MPCGKGPAYIRKQKAQDHKEKRAHKTFLQALKAKHQGRTHELLEKSLLERHTLRQGIEWRLNEMVNRQVITTEEVKQSVANDKHIMQLVLLAEVPTCNRNQRRK